jgi:hypothetical protein
MAKFFSWDFFSRRNRVLGSVGQAVILAAVDETFLKGTSSGWAAVAESSPPSTTTNAKKKGGAFAVNPSAR